MTPFDATTAALLVKQAREDDERMTPGPWSARRENRYPWIEGQHDEMLGDNATIVEWSNTSEGADRDARGIARTRNNLRAMADQLEAACAEVAEARAEEKRQRGIVHELSRWIDAPHHHAAWMQWVDEGKQQLHEARAQLAAAQRERDEARGVLDRYYAATRGYTEGEPAEEFERLTAELAKMRPVYEAAKRLRATFASDCVWTDEEKALANALSTKEQP